LFGSGRTRAIIDNALRSETVHLTFNHAKRIRPAAAPRVSAATTQRVNACVVLTGDGSMWLDLPSSFG